MFGLNLQNSRCRELTVGGAVSAENFWNFQICCLTLQNSQHKKFKAAGGVLAGIFGLNLQNSWCEEFKMLRGCASKKFREYFAWICGIPDVGNSRPYGATVSAENLRNPEVSKNHPTYFQYHRVEIESYQWPYVQLSRWLWKTISTFEFGESPDHPTCC